MLVFLVRHAHAVSGDPDELRELSERGREEARALAQRLSEHETPPALVLTSPLLRARQTATEISRAADAELRVEERLLPGATAELLLDAVEGLDGPVATVGHQPDCSNIALELTAKDPGFPTAGVAELTIES
jgi:phosphohistidine phosphatase